MFKRFFRKLDAIVFSSFFESSNQKNTTNPISLLCDKYGSDKGSILEKDHPYGWPPHTYSDYYHLLFSSRRQHIKRVLNVTLEQTIQIFYPQWARWESQAHHYEFGVTTFLMQLFMGQAVIRTFCSLKKELKRFTLIN